jgi:hypothetical protein
MSVVTSINLPCGYDILKPITPGECSPVSVRLRMIYHNISVGLYTNQHFLRHCLEWFLDLFIESCVKKCQQ